MIKLKRIYENPNKDDGFRILVDRLWPRGISRQQSKIDLWLKDIAPSDSLIKWFRHKPERWQQFKIKYKNELKSKQDLVTKIKELEKNYKTITFLFSAKDVAHNNAVVLKEFVEKNSS
ncbi:MAG: hypothetical protein KatS3mg090_0441 [Patescibacteria group bacterium]|nr:MAG: hypothetical protein KatS3mg090_0441 [Patescibacteria group bacterium]